MKSDIDQLIQKARRTGQHFTRLREMAVDIVSGNSTPDAIRLARQLYDSDVHHARSLAAYIFGLLAANSKQCMRFLRMRVGRDTDWRVQEFLAQAFDRYCSDVGYVRAVPTIKHWLSDPNPNVRRAVIEGLRIWTSRPYFREHPEIAVRLLSSCRSDESAFVRKSAGNALRDISRRYKDLVNTELRTWDLSEEPVRQTYKLAGKFL